jgi:CO/xanthine dehydrogenase Mo-binding subunit
MVGNVIAGELRSGEVLDRLASKPIWTGRGAERTRRAAAVPNKAYGVGLACVSTVFGTGSDPAFALIEITPAGRITVTSQAVEIGTGICPLLRRPARAYPRGSEIDALDRVGRENL